LSFVLITLGGKYYETSTFWERYHLNIPRCIEKYFQNFFLFYGTFPIIFTLKMLLEDSKYVNHIDSK